MITRNTGNGLSAINHSGSFRNAHGTMEERGEMYLYFSLEGSTRVTGVWGKRRKASQEEEEMPRIMQTLSQVMGRFRWIGRLVLQRPPPSRSTEEGGPVYGHGSFDTHRSPCAWLNGKRKGESRNKDQGVFHSVGRERLSEKNLHENIHTIRVVLLWGKGLLVGGSK